MQRVPACQNAHQGKAMKEIFKREGLVLALLTAAVILLVWLVRMNTLPLAVLWLGCPIAAWLLTVQSVSACLTIRGRGILGIILIGLSIFASLAMDAHRREVTDWIGSTCLEGYTVQMEGADEHDEQDNDDPRFSNRPHHDWTATSDAGTLALTVFQIVLFASLFAVPLATWWLSRDARDKMEQEYWRLEHKKATGQARNIVR